MNQDVLIVCLMNQDFQNKYNKKVVGIILIINYLFTNTAWKLSKYGVFSGPYFSGFGQNAGKYGPEKTSYFTTFHVV